MDELCTSPTCLDNNSLVHKYGPVPQRDVYMHSSNNIFGCAKLLYKYIKTSLIISWMYVICPIKFRSIREDYISLITACGSICYVHIWYRTFFSPLLSYNKKFWMLNLLGLLEKYTMVLQRCMHIYLWVKMLKY